ncbi:integral membrane protein [Streptomyces sp. AS58]|uniref:DUF7144 family membrane protein n=1 Tax=Streptomyces sp. AS58 TaxID=1519489 RepID=UPI0006C66A19|nr:hypothetical protein [Streptomyces sp. AS58]KOV70062.1 integral membrane protein [Streptomyces sp. AS58]
MAAIPNKKRQEEESPASSGMITGVTLFAATLLMLSGPLSILLGTAGIAGDTLFSSPRYAYRFDLTAWGWIHLVIGVALVIAGMGVVAGKSWGRGAGIVAAAISLITQFMFIPYYPAWSIIVMILDLLIVWALSRFDHKTSGAL